MNQCFYPAVDTFGKWYDDKKKLKSLKLLKAVFIEQQRVQNMSQKISSYTWLMLKVLK